MTFERAMVLCAGFGTRLRPLTDERPKPLVPIGDATLLARIVADLRSAGVGHLVVNAHHLADSIDAAGRDLGLEVVCERRILGTAGGVAHASEALGAGEVLVLNGDILAELDVVALGHAHAQAHALATLAVADVREPGAGTVGIDEAGTVVRLRGERFGREAHGADFVGAQVLTDAARSEIPQEGCIVGDVYLPLLRRGARLATAPVVRRWWDVGTPRAYLDCNLAWLRDRDATHWSAGSIAVGVTARDSLIGAGASVTGSGSLEEVVVWPDTRITAPLSRAIVTPRGVVPAGNL